MPSAQLEAVQVKQAKSPARPERRALVALLVVVSTTLGAARARGALPGEGSPNPAGAGDTVRPAAVDSTLERALDSLAGLSGKLRFKLVADPRELEIPVVSRLFGGAKTREPGVHSLMGADSSDRSFSLVTLVPFEARTSAGRIGPYRMGFWPAEKRGVRSEAYANPDGFIEVTPENQDTRVSEHFRLRDFLTKDQASVWPKYLVLRTELIDKLELVISELGRRGIAVRHMTVMSGFRTPQYNQKGVGSGGRATNSRHQYGDAADVFVDNDRNGRMDDLNRDGRVDHRDAQVILDAAERVERAHPVLVGGGGLYRATASHGPFAHIDVRGTKARW
jgi:hypothetical protein